ncbi:unnamed protein product, partial [Closterium sp. NIES-65]
HGVEQLVLGLYIIRGDNIAVVGELDEDLDSSALHAPLPLDKLMCHVAGTGRPQDASGNSLFKGQPPGDHPQAVLLLPGSFNPPTIMHLRMLGAWVAGRGSTGSQLRTAGGTWLGLAPAKERVAMCQLACADSPFIMVDPWEASQQCYQRTLCVLRRLHQTLNAPPAPTPSSAAQAPSSAAQAPSSAAQAPSPAAQAPSSAAQAPSSAAQAPSSAAQAPSSAAQAPSAGAHPLSPMHSQPSLRNQSSSSPLAPHPTSHPHPFPPFSTPSHPHPPSPESPQPHPPLHTHMWALEGATGESPSLLPTAAAGTGGWGRGAEGGKGGGEGGRGAVGGREGGGNREEGEDDGGQGVSGVGESRREEGERHLMGVVASGVTGEMRESGGGVGGQGVEAAEGQRVGEGRVQVMLVCGADLLQSFTKPGVWVPSHVEEVLGAHGVVCIARQGADAHQLVLHSHLLHRHRHNILIVDQPIENNISSSRIRRLLQRGLSAKYLVPDAVLHHIRAARLYECAD